MNIHEIREKLKTSGLPVFRTRDIARIAGLEYKPAMVYIKRMVEKSLLKRISKGIYALDDDPFLVASFIFPNSYISFNSALYLHSLINQVPVEVEVATPMRANRKVDGVRFVHLPKNLIFGFKKTKYKSHHIYVAEKEKAIVDLAYRYKHVAPELMGSMDKIKLEDYAERMGSSVVRRLNL